MIGSRVVAGLSLLCALLFCAVSASSAMAVNEGTTAFTCAPVAVGEDLPGFADEHCTTAVGSKANWVHKEIKPGEETAIVGTNLQTEESTKKAKPMTLKTTYLGIAIEIVCKKVESKGTLTNNAGPPMKVTGTIGAEYSECTLTKPTTCTVQEPISFIALFESKVEGGEMWITYTHDAKAGGEPLTLLEFEIIEKAKCPKVLVNEVFELKGSAASTPNGATWEFPEKEPHSNLTIEGAAATLSLSETMRAKAGFPIALTTTAT
jgi:hypothetical protein